MSATGARAVLEDPRVRPVEHLGDQRQVVATKARGGPPAALVLEEPFHGDVVNVLPAPDLFAQMLARTRPILISSTGFVFAAMCVLLSVRVCRSVHAS
jgi:hypothetical protein